ncbi:MAG: hypothetical protein SGILL_001119 [Bacillariaceae sp.]
MSVFDQCTDACGWVAAVIAALSYGSFGVPIKGTNHIPAHPLILQSYKTFVMFLTCWGVTLLGVDIAFTKWGLLSGLLWVIGGTGGIYGIRCAGLAIAVGTWASIMVMINFLFGILVFQEPVADIFGTLCSFLFLIVGLVGMSQYSAPQRKDTTMVAAEVHENGDDEGDDDAEHLNYQPLPEDPQPDAQQEEPLPETEGLQRDVSITAPEPMNDQEEEKAPHLILFHGRLLLTKRQCGILGAAMNGVMTGGSLVPVHYAKEEGFGGARYFPSFACGALIANVSLWCLYFVVQALLGSGKGRSIQETISEMPRLYFRELWFPAGIAGLLLSLAMFTSILAVTYLGQAVGNSLVQAKILVSGCWGILWFHEIVGPATIAKWFASAGICILAIIWLSLERLEAKSGENHHLLI